jgi:hypothetical protein
LETIGSKTNSMPESDATTMAAVWTRDGPIDLLDK